MDPNVFTAIISVVVTCVEILGVLAAIHAIMHARTAQGAIAWFFALIGFPLVALPFYWIFGRRRFLGYLVSRRKGEGEVQRAVSEKLDEYKRDFEADLSGSQHRFLPCEKFVGIPFLSGNHVELLIDGEQTFDAIFDGIKAAEKYVFVEYFIIHDDAIGREFHEHLMDKAREGVRVLLMYDEIGTRKMKGKLRRKLVEAGVDVRAFASTRGWRNRFQLNFRNHRKIVVVDGKQAFVGGLNVGDEYMGRSKKFGHWRDTHLAVTGPAVAPIQLAFAEDWFWGTSGERVDGMWDVERSDRSNYDSLVLPTGPADEVETCGLFFTHLINVAKERVWIASPYFVPDRGIMAALKLAVLRGVDVRVLLPGTADHRLVYWSSFSFIADAEPIGVKFFRYEQGFMHQKVVLVDDDFAAVGTANFDNRSFRLNFEITIAVAEKEFAAGVETMLTRDFENSRQVTADESQTGPFWFRFAVAASRLMSPIQ